jgi:hypothetical protein
MASIINASTSGAGGVITTADASGQLELQTAGTTRMTIDVNGNVAVGATTSTLPLQVYVSTDGITAFGTHTASGSAYIQLRPDGNAGSVIRYGGLGSNANILRFVSDGPAEHMRIDSDGNVLIQTTTPSSISNVGAAFQPTTNSRAILYLGTSTTVTNALTSFRNPNGQVGTITVSGSATTYNTSSDYRLKEDVSPMTGALDKVALLKPVTYKWKVDGSDGQGFIAHELQEVVPECVSGEKDAVDAEGNPEYQGVDTSFLVATLTAAIQELKARIEVLEGASA